MNKTTPLFEYDVLIIGCGVAGLCAAIKLAESKNLSIAIITREKKPEMTNTLWAQGGIVYAQDEHREALDQDIQRASSFTSSKEAIDVILNHSRKIVDEILIDKAKTSFSHKSTGELNFTKEAAHSVPRIIYNGDFTGKSIEISLLNYISDSTKFPNVVFFTSHTAIDLITPAHHGIDIKQRYEKHKVVGAYVFDQETEVVKKIISKRVILATGGISAMYLHHSNNDGARGDGQAMAKRAGARVINMEFIQFHPTTLYIPSSHRRFLMTEALRGEGGILINSKGDRFMEKYHGDLELAPRDIVSRAIMNEMISQGQDNVYLDISHKDSSWIKDRFPTIYQHCLDYKIDISKQPIPVVPAAHYTCGGVKTDRDGLTDIENLYAVGEVACTGLHGANRLASTSLLEGLTWGYQSAARIIKDKIENERLYDYQLINDWSYADQNIDLNLVAQDWSTLKQTMWNYVGIERSRSRLLRARAMFSEMFDEVQRFYKNAKLHDQLIGLRNSLEVGFMVTKASMKNKKSIGCFFISEDR